MVTSQHAANFDETIIVKNIEVIIQVEAYKKSVFIGVSHYTQKNILKFFIV